MQDLETKLDEECKNKEHADASAFVMMLMSHGRQGRFLTTDGIYINTEDDVVTKFDGENFHIFQKHQILHKNLITPKNMKILSDSLLCSLFQRK